MTIWIHAVSVGEIKAAQPLYLELRKLHPDSFILITTVTATGLAEAKRSLPGANEYLKAPIDFPWVVRHWVRKYNPKLYLLVETDFWPNLLSALKKNNCKIALVSGKLTERSAKRFSFFKFFSRWMFSKFDLLCVQNEEHKARFQPFCPQIYVTGNLKLDLTAQPVQKAVYPFPAITISCTHAPEEELLLEALKDLNLFIFLAPRHPHRFNEVADILTRKNIPFTRWTQNAPHAKVLLVDTMGQLPTCYAHSQLTLVAGSFIDGIGGHNVLEPLLYNTPVFFGPYTQKQTEFAARAIQSGAGKCFPISELKQAVETFFNTPEQRQKMVKSAGELIASGRGSAERTLNLLKKNILSKSGIVLD
jgi:3-deoxy-D-manno-octulosonic-acid transferase